MKILRLVLIFLAVLFILSASSAHATTNRFNLMKFYPNPDGSNFFHLLDSQNLYQWRFAAGTMLTLGYEPLKEKSTARKVVNYLIEDHFFGTVGFTDWIEMSVDIPLALGDDFIDPDPVAAPSGTWKINVGDVRVLFKGQILERCCKPVGLAIAPFVTIPSGKQRYFLGEGSVSGGADLILDADIGKYVTLLFNGGLEVGEKVVFRNVDRGKLQIRLGGGASFKATKDLSVIVEGFVSSPTNHFFKDRVHSPAEVIGGVQYRVGDTGFIINAGGGAGVVSGVGAPRARGFAGLTYRFTKPLFLEKDARKLACKVVEAPPMTEAQMMIVELKEICPPPENFNPEVHDARCPKYYDLREFAELVIKCPGRPEDFNPALHDQACPKVYELADILSKEEISIVYAMSAVELSLRCPESPNLYNPKVHDQACPKYYDLQEIVAMAGKCPPPEKFNAEIHDSACLKVFILKDKYAGESWATIMALSEKDTDSDGIKDLLDRCPSEPGVAVRQGCPAGKAVVAGDVLKTAQPIEFAFNSYTITSSMVPVLFEVAETMALNPGMRLRIDGYTDSVGSKWANKRVSSARAHMVKDYLLKIGVPPSRVTVAGMGESSFVASNTTATGRAKNRRVAFIIISK